MKYAYSAEREECIVGQRVGPVLTVPNVIKGNVLRVEANFTWDASQPELKVFGATFKLHPVDPQEATAQNDDSVKVYGEFIRQMITHVVLFDCHPQTEFGVGDVQFQIVVEEGGALLGHVENFYMEAEIVNMSVV
ncbi:hypothetical protein KAR48_05360 [bacterium]|nr:hypothetical protein [bacterium]